MILVDDNESQFLKPDTRYHYNTFILSSPDEEPDPKKILLDSLRKMNLEDVVFFETPDKKTWSPDIGTECVLYEQ